MFDIKKAAQNMMAPAAAGIAAAAALTTATPAPAATVFDETFASYTQPSFQTFTEFDFDIFKMTASKQNSILIFGATTPQFVANHSDGALGLNAHNDTGNGTFDLELISGGTFTLDKIFAAPILNTSHTDLFAEFFYANQNQSPVTVDMSLAGPGTNEIDLNGTGDNIKKVRFTSPLLSKPESQINRLVGSVTGVPEPATWAFMTLGFGVLGAALRARRSATLRHDSNGPTGGDGPAVAG